MTLRSYATKVLVGGLVGGIGLNVLYFLIVTMNVSMELFLIGFLIGAVVNGLRYIRLYLNQLRVNREVDRVDGDFTREIREFVKKSESIDFLDYKEYGELKESFMTNEEAEKAYKLWNDRLGFVEKFIGRTSPYMFDRGFPDNAFLNGVLSDSGWMTNDLYNRLTNSQRMRNEYIKIREDKKEFDRRLAAYELGNEGERIVLSELRKYGDRFTVLDGIRFSTSEAVVGQELDGKTVENDVLVFTNNGLYTLEIKNIMSEGEKYLRISKDGVWYKKTREDGSWKADPNTTKIFSQVNRQVHYTESLIERKLGKKIPLTSVIVIANDNVQIENETDWLIVRPNMLFSLLNGGDASDGTLTDVEINELVDMFKTYDLGAGKFPVRVFENEIEVWENNARAVETMLFFREDTWQIFDRTQREMDKI